MTRSIAALLELACCPECKGTLRHGLKENLAICSTCRFSFPIIDEYTVDLRLDHAILLTDKGKRVLATHQHAVLKPLKGPVVASLGERPLSLGRGQCLVVARTGMRGIDPDRATLLNLDTLLDPNAKQMLAKYMASRTELGARTMDPEHVFGFRRNPDVIVADTSISRLHCLFFFDEKSLGVFDLFSRNGTFVNGKEVEFQFLKDGDIIQFGQSACQIVMPK